MTHAVNAGQKASMPVEATVWMPLFIGRHKLEALRLRQ